LVLALGLNVALGQRSDNHTVYFKDIDGFSGYVKFKTLYEGFATQLKANSGEVVITGYDATNEEIVALNKAGLGLKRHTGSFRPSKFSFEVVGRAHIVTPAKHLALSDSKLTISESLGDYTTPSFNDATKKAAEAWGKSHKESYWERFGGFRGEKVTALYLTELKNEINRILGDYRSSMRAFETSISSGTSDANGFNFIGAEDALAEARELSNGSREHLTKISGLEKLIASRKKKRTKQTRKRKRQTKKWKRKRQDQHLALQKVPRKKVKTRMKTKKNLNLRRKDTFPRPL